MSDIIVRKTRVQKDGQHPAIRCKPTTTCVEHDTEEDILLICTLDLLATFSCLHHCRLCTLRVPPLPHLHLHPPLTYTFIDPRRDGVHRHPHVQPVEPECTLDHTMTSGLGTPTDDTGTCSWSLSCSSYVIIRTPASGGYSSSAHMLEHLLPVGINHGSCCCCLVGTNGKSKCLG